MDPTRLLGGRFEFVKRLLGRSDRGIITWLALDQNTGNQVVASIIAVSRAETLQRVIGFTHERLATIIDIVRDFSPDEIPEQPPTGRRWAVVLAASIPGVSLHRRLKTSKLRPYRAVRCIAQSAFVVAAIHEQGAIHGGLSTRAVLVRRADGGPEPAVTQIVVPPDAAFFSPERLGGLGPSVSDDTWALSAMLYAGLTGERPFPGETASQVAKSVAGQRIKPLKAFGVDDPNLQRILDRGFMRDTKTRATSAHDLLADLTLWLSEHRAEAGEARSQDEEPQNGSMQFDVEPATGELPFEQDRLVEGMGEFESVPSGPVSMASMRAFASASLAPTAAHGLHGEGSQPSKEEASDVPDLAELLSALDPMLPTAPAVPPVETAPVPGLFGFPIGDLPTPVLTEVDAPSSPGPVSARLKRAAPVASAHRDPRTPLVAPPPRTIDSPRRPDSAAKREQLLPVVPAPPILQAEPLPLSPLFLPPEPSAEISAEPAQAAIAVLPTATAVAASPAQPRQSSAMWIAGAVLGVLVVAAGAVVFGTNLFRSSPSRESLGADSQAEAAATVTIENSPVAQQAPPTETTTALAPFSTAPAASTPSASSPSPVSALATPASVADTINCVASYFPSDTFVVPQDLTFVCAEKDGRRGVIRMRSKIVLGSRGALTDGMGDWSRLQWYELAVYGIARRGCCPDAPDLELPTVEGPCESLATPIELLARAVGAHADVETRVTDFEKAVLCVFVQPAKPYNYPGGAGGVARQTFDRFLKRALSRGSDP